MDIKNKIMSLCDANGYENGVEKGTKLALEYLLELTDKAYIKNGNVIGEFGERQEGKPHILIDAHIDKIGFVASFIDDDGFVKVANYGGIDRRLLPAQKVRILHDNGTETFGVISTIPPHLSNSGEKKVPEISDICIDVGLSKEDACERISLGDKIVFDTDSAELFGDRITASGLDDRCGVVTILRAVELALQDKINCSFTVLFSEQEEVGERGAKIAAYDINPDIAIAVDVSFALTSDDSELKCGVMTKGPMIGIAPTLDRELSKKFIEIAKNNEIPYQIEVMSGETGTNADRFSVNNSGAKTVTISIPLKYMHTPVEVISICDIENTAKLIAKYISEVC